MPASAAACRGAWAGRPGGRARMPTAPPPTGRPAADPCFPAACDGGRPAAGRRTRCPRSAGARRGARRARPGCGPANPGHRGRSPAAQEARRKARRRARRRALGRERVMRRVRSSMRGPVPVRAARVSGPFRAPDAAAPPPAAPSRAVPTADGSAAVPPDHRSPASVPGRVRGRGLGPPAPVPPAAGPRAAPGPAARPPRREHHRPGRPSRRGRPPRAVRAGACPGRDVREARRPGPRDAPERRWADAPRTPQVRTSQSRTSQSRCPPGRALPAPRPAQPPLRESRPARQRSGCAGVSPACERRSGAVRCAGAVPPRDGPAARQQRWARRPWTGGPRTAGDRPQARRPGRTRPCSGSACRQPTAERRPTAEQWRAHAPDRRATKAGPAPAPPAPAPRRPAGEGGSPRPWDARRPAASHRG